MIIALIISLIFVCEYTSLIHDQILSFFSFSAGMISGLLRDKSLDDSIDLGMKAAAISLVSHETVPEKLKNIQLILSP